MNLRLLVSSYLLFLATVYTTAAEKSIKVFILAGDENVLEQGIISRQKDGNEVPGTLVDVISKQERFSFLKGQDGNWVTRDEVILYDGDPIHNNTVSAGSPLRVGDRAYGGRRELKRIGPELMLGHTLGEALEEPVMLIRFGTHSVFHTPGSRSLAHDFLPPSRGGAADLDGGWDVIHFNWGIWDTGIFRGRHPDRENGKYRVPIDEYEKNMKILVGKLKKTGATLIFGNTTPIYEGTPGRIKGDAVKYNKVAETIMKENGITVNDLHGEAIRQGFPKRPDVHSVGNLGPKALEAITTALKDRKTTAKPLPRVLIIGDSISSPYYRYVKKELEGKVSVYHNPGNGQHSRTGVEKIDEWLELKTYLLSGEEYVQLLNAYKQVVNDPNRFFPDYKGQKLELSGLIWFQHIKDSQSTVKANTYEANLAALITDLRKDFGIPNLPVVVTTGPHAKTAADRPPRVVHDAQMAVSNPKKYPDFAGTVVSVDTTPFFRAKDKSPGLAMRRGPYYKPERYNNNAESFLLIGEATGKAMLKLLGDVDGK